MRVTQFGIIGLAGIIAVVALVGLGSIPEGLFLALLVFILIGSVAPMVVFPIGLVALLVLLLKGDVGTKAIAWVGNLTRVASVPSSPLRAFDPTVKAQGA